MKDVFESIENDLRETCKQNELLKDQLLEAKLKHEIECCVLLSHECVNNNVQDEVEKIQRDSIKIQEGMQKRINIIENDVQRYLKQSLDFELQLQHEKERQKYESSLKNVCETSWISKMEKLESENVSLEFQVQSLIKDQVHAQNQDLLITISELKARLKKVEKEEKHVLLRTVTLQTSPNKKKDVETNKNVIAPRMYKVKIPKTQEIITNKAKSVLPSMGLKDAFSVRIPSNKDSSFKNSVLTNTKNSSEKVEVYVRKNKNTYVASKNVVSNKNIVTDTDVKNALKAKDVLCVSCAKNVLIPCHDKCLANYKLNVHSKFRRALFTTPRIVKTKFEDTTPIVSKTRFSVKTTQSKSLDTTPVVSKTKIAAVTPLSAKNKVSSAFKTITVILRDKTLSKYMKNKIQTSQMWQKCGHSKHMTSDRSLLENFVEKFMGTVCFGNDHFGAITGYGNYVQGNITVKSTKSSHPPKVVPNNHSKLELLHMDLCGPIRVASINGKKYILVIVDDYSRFTWVYFLHTKYESPEIINNFIAWVQLNYNAKVHKIRTDNGTEFKNATLKAHDDKLGIMQQFVIARTPQQNGVVERRNHTLVEATRTIYLFMITKISLG
ncbi:retrovirus-related pol polyprotein from transposon TNT 1-94 [Tanacetum coccineum]